MAHFNPNHSLLSLFSPLSVSAQSQSVNQSHAPRWKGGQIQLRLILLPIIVYPESASFIKPPLISDIGSPLVTCQISPRWNAVFFCQTPSALFEMQLGRHATLLSLEVNVRLREREPFVSTWHHGSLHSVTEEFSPRSDDRLSCFAAFLAHDFFPPLRNVCPNSNHNCGLRWQAGDARNKISLGHIFRNSPAV